MKHAPGHKDLMSVPARPAVTVISAIVSERQSIGFLVFQVHDLDLIFKNKPNPSHGVYPMGTSKLTLPKTNITNGMYPWPSLPPKAVNIPARTKAPGGQNPNSKDFLVKALIFEQQTCETQNNLTVQPVFIPRLRVVQ